MSFCPSLVAPEDCSANDPIVLEWNAFLSYLETWTKCLKLPADKARLTYQLLCAVCRDDESV